MAKQVKCPECDEIINILDDAQTGDIIECHGKKDTCFAELEIISLDPPMVSVLIEEK